MAWYFAKETHGIITVLGRNMPSGTSYQFAGPANISMMLKVEDERDAAVLRTTAGIVEMDPVRGAVKLKNPNVIPPSAPVSTFGVAKYRQKHPESAPVVSVDERVVAAAKQAAECSCVDCDCEDGNQPPVAIAEITPVTSDWDGVEDGEIVVDLSVGSVDGDETDEPAPPVRRRGRPRK